MKLLSRSQPQVLSISSLLVFIAVASSLVLSLLASNQVFAQPQTPSAPAKPGKISGRVTNPAGEPLAGIAVCSAISYRFVEDCHVYEPYNGQTLLTDANGEYQITGLGSGEYNIYFYDPAHNYSDQYFDQVPLTGTPTPILVVGNAVSGIDATLTPSAKITGTLALLAANSYIASGQINLFQATLAGWQIYNSYMLAPTSQTYQFLDLPPGDYRLCANVQIGWQASMFPDSSDQECYHEAATVEQAVSLVLTTGVTLHDINFLFGEEAGQDRQVVGRVTDTAGQPLAGITVFGYPDEPYADSEWSALTQTDGAGYYELLNPRYNHYILQFFDQTGQHGFTYYPNVPTLAEATPITLTRQVITNVNATLGNSAQISGHVHYSSGDAPAQGQIQLFQQMNRVWSRILPIPLAVDAKTGSYQVGGLAPGVYRLAALDHEMDYPLYADGYYGGATLAEATNVQLTTGETATDVDIELAQGRYEGVITGTVTAAGQGLSMIQITLYRLLTGILESRPTVKVLQVLTDANGHYTITGLEAGSYKVHFSDPSQQYAAAYAGDALQLTGSPTYIIDRSQMTVNVNAVLQRPGHLSGTVRTSAGAPLSAIAVRAIGFDATNNVWCSSEVPFAITDAAGHYEISGLLPGRYRLYFFDQTVQYRNRYYGATEQSELAQTLEVNAGAVQTGLDVTLAPNQHTYLPLLIAPPRPNS